MAAKQGYTVFAATAPRICRDLLRDLPVLDADDTFAICGNLGHESAGLTAFQEVNPTVPGSAGGWGWGQWTGARRRAFFAWIKAKGFTDPKSYAANYGFLLEELKGSEKAAVTALKRVTRRVGEAYDDFLRRKVVAFELGFERAGVKHYDSRMSWAKRAKAAYEAGTVAQPSAPAAPLPQVPLPQAPLQPTPPLPQVPLPQAPAPAKKPAVVTPKRVGEGIGAAFLAWLSTQGWKLAAFAAIVVFAYLIGRSVYKKVTSK